MADSTLSSSDTIGAKAKIDLDNLVSELQKATTRLKGAELEPDPYAKFFELSAVTAQLSRISESAEALGRHEVEYAAAKKQLEAEKQLAEAAKL